ncbi:MAG: hypothetical protein KAQ96_14270, partial [Thermoplasmata archaeon]|nr:hypothetical protein [Thermoplasmata archaeon]
WDASLQKREQEIIKHQESLDAQSKQVDADSEALQARVVEMETELSTFDERKAALEEMEADLADNKEGLDKATIELANLEKHLQNVESEIRDCPYCDAKDNFIRTRRLIDEAEALDADVMDARRMLRMAQDKLDSADFDGAVKDAFDAQQSARLARSNFLKAGIKFLLSSVRKSLDSNENQGVNVSDAKRTLERAREASLEGRYEEAEQMAREADDLGRLLLSQYNEYQSLRVKAMAMITNGLEGNERVQELIAEADGRASGGDYRRGIDALEKAVEITVEDMSGSEPADQAQPARVVKEVVSRKRKVVADAVTEEGAEGTLDEEVTFEEVVSEEVVEAGDE